MTAHSLLSNKVFMRVFTSYSLSMLGIYFDRVAIFLLFAYVWQERPLMLALIAVAIALPQALISQFTGVFIENKNKIKIMLLADMTTALLTFSLLFISNAWFFLVILTLRSTIATVHFPAEQAIIKQIVPESLVMRAVSLNGLSAQFSRIIGPVVGGTLAALYSPLLCIFINGVTLILSCLLLLSVLQEGKTTSSSRTKKKNSFWGDWREGWWIILKTRTLQFCFFYSFLGFFAVQMVDVQFPILFRMLAPDRPEIIGWIMSFVGIGSVLIIVFLSRYKQLPYPTYLLIISFLCLGIVLLSAGFLTTEFHLSGPLLMAIILGFGVGLQMIVAQYVIQTETNGETIARVSSLYNSIISLSILIAPLVGAFFVEILSIYPVLRASGIFLFCIGAVAFLTEKNAHHKAPSSLIKQSS
ncbi:MFS transporter [Alkalihalophilus sp. As8PL]|uniref:MFS transporter n=1 Tax=Alkalihalophilus sp. As8PL TaxID=3237103 RepID=A0AB39BUJ8_9BACI